MAFVRLYKTHQTLSVKINTKNCTLCKDTEKSLEFWSENSNYIIKSYFTSVAIIGLNNPVFTKKLAA